MWCFVTRHPCKIIRGLRFWVSRVIRSSASTPNLQPPGPSRAKKNEATSSLTLNKLSIKSLNLNYFFFINLLLLDHSNQNKAFFLLTTPHLSFHNFFSETKGKACLEKWVIAKLNSCWVLREQIWCSSNWEFWCPKSSLAKSLPKVL